jgi:hypothetical protein
MSFTTMAALILGCDVLLYGLFLWLYPDRTPKSRPGLDAHDLAMRHSVPQQHIQLR